MGLAHNTQRLICRVVLRGCCWLRNTRDSQLARGAAARLLCESGSVATARPCQRTGPSSSRPKIFLLLWCPSNGLCLHCGPARVLPAARAAAATPRRVTSKVQSSVRFLFRRKPKAAEILAEDRFFLNCFWKFDFRLAFSATRISRRRPVLRLLLLLC